MYSLSVCKGCGRTIKKGFLYCPWCGYSRVSNDDESLDVLFNKFEQIQKDNRRKQIMEMERDLEALEKELSILVLSTEMHK